MSVKNATEIDREITMGARLDYRGTTIAANFGKYLNSAGKAVTDSSLPAATQALVKIWASQINGCAPCTDAHTKDAEHAGETSVRLNLIAVWREATVFTDAERAALELTEQGTRIADAAGGVTDQAWANAAKHYDDDQLAALVSLIAVINAYNRLNVILQRPGGDYQPGQWDNDTAGHPPQIRRGVRVRETWDSGGRSAWRVPAPR
jgi:AhpD family alkylhydroperoxidase